MTEPKHLHNLNQTQPYASKTKESVKKLAKKFQAIDMNSIDGIKIEYYVYAVGDNTGAFNILYISMNRICVYLTNKGYVDELCNKHQKIHTNNTDINVRPIITHVKRLILSNVCPTIPNNTTENELRRAT